MKTRQLLYALVSLLVGTPVLAAAPPTFKVFGGASYVSPLGEDDVTFGSITDSVEASDELGWTVGLEARVNQILGFEFDYVNATNDIEFGGDVIGEVEMQPLSATLNFHLIPTSIVDLYIGPTASYFIFDDVEIDSGGTLETDDEFAYGASLGLEIGLGQTFAILGGVRWLKVDLAPEGAEEVAVDPLFSRLGVALRF